MILRNIDFGNPFPLGTEVPARRGIYLVCTESSGGIKIIGVYGSDNMSKSFAENKYAKKWSEYEDDGMFIYFSKDTLDALNLEMKVRDIIDTRFYDVVCVDKLDDSW